MCFGGGSPPRDMDAGTPRDAGGPIAGCPEPEFRMELYWVYDDNTGTNVAHAYRKSNVNQKQYINLDRTASHPQYGRLLRFKARFLRRAGSVPVPNRDIVWSVQRGARNRAHLSGAMRGGLGGGRADEIHSRTDAQGYATVDLYMSQYGGDRFQLWARDGESADTSSQRCTDWFEGWRKLWCEIDCMTRDPSGTSPDPSCTTYCDIEVGYLRSTLLPGLNRKLVDNDLFLEFVEAPWGTAAPISYRKITAASQHLAMVSSVRAAPTATEGLTAAQIECRSYHIAFIDGWYNSTGTTYYGNAVAGTINPPPGTANVNRLCIWLGIGHMESTGVTLFGADWVNLILSTLLHEILHQIGLASAFLPDGTDIRGPHASHDTGRGWHCGRVGRGDTSSDTCIMYQTVTESTTVLRDTLCEQCIDAARGRNLSSLPIGPQDAW
jgi:hypothetical protein